MEGKFYFGLLQRFLPGQATGADERTLGRQLREMWIAGRDRAEVEGVGGGSRSSSLLGALVGRRMVLIRARTGRPGSPLHSDPLCSFGNHDDASNGIPVASLHLLVSFVEDPGLFLDDWGCFFGVTFASAKSNPTWNSPGGAT